ncbi:40S ribosomal protein S27 [Musa troglodytarum]|uniref:40S ribosomal protein S27 n=1 Tax=Musa troglodytarum TaxID=320322 RepID=A0A9E7GQI7_9LILI|nr:40S ribosomal protein S27 [Musa troglodytarum]
MPGQSIGLGSDQTEPSSCGTCRPIQTIREPGGVFKCEWADQIAFVTIQRSRLTFSFLYIYIHIHVYASSPRLGFTVFSRCRLRDFLSRFRGAPKVSTKMVLPNDIDLLNPPAELEKRKHKLKRLVQSPNSFFMNYCVQPLADRGRMRQLPDGPLPADRGARQAHRGLLLPAEGRLSIGPTLALHLFVGNA